MTTQRCQSSCLKPSLSNRLSFKLQILTHLFPVKRTTIDDLLMVGGVPPPPPTPPASIPGTKLEEIKHLYSTMYAPYIDKFLETKWFQLKGLAYLLTDTRLCEQYASLISRFQTDPRDIHSAAITQSLEASTLWSTMMLCRQVASNPSNNNPSTTNGNSRPQVTYNEHPSSEGVLEAAKHLDIFETLVSNSYLDTEPLPHAEPNTRNNPHMLDDQLKWREREFWRLVGKFLTLRDDEASSAKEIDDCLSACRTLLDSRENRDVIYSIAIARHVGQRMAEFPNSMVQPSGNDEQDAKTKLYVAKKFVEEEATGKGTNQVIQRMCGMAVRSWGLAR